MNIKKRFSPTPKPTPEERLEELKWRVHICALRKLLSKSDGAIPIHDIESHRGRQQKAVLNLTKARHLRFIGRSKENKWSSEINYYWTDTLEDYLKVYAEQDNPMGEDTVRDHLEEVILGAGGNYRKTRNLLEVGWVAIQNASLPRLASAWSEKDQYLFMGEGSMKNRYDNDNPDCNALPWEDCKKPLLMIRRDAYKAMPKLLLRNAAEIYAGVMYDRLMALDAHLKGSSHETALTVTVANIGAMVPTPENLIAVSNQCLDAIEALRAYIETCNKVADSVDRHGSEWQKDILKLAIKDMLSAAPALAMGASHPSVYHLLHMNALAKYILEHAQWMDYTRLYDDRPGNWVVGRGQAYVPSFWDESRKVDFGPNEAFKKALGMDTEA